MPNNQETISIKVAVSDAASRPFDQIAEKAKALGKELEDAGKTGTTALGKVDSAATDAAKNIDKRAGEAGDSLGKINKALDGNVRAFQDAGSGIDRALGATEQSLGKVATAAGDAGTKAARNLEQGIKSADLGSIGRQQGQDAASGMEQAIGKADIGGAVKKATAGADTSGVGTDTGHEIGGNMVSAFGGSDFGGAISTMVDKAKTAGEAGGGKLSGYIAGGLAGLATVLAGVLLEGWASFQAKLQEKGITEAAFGATPEQAGVLVDNSTKLNNRGWGGSLPEVTGNMRTVGSQLGLNADDPGLTALTRKAMAIEAASGHGVDEITRAAKKMVDTGLEPTVDSAMDTITKGFQMNLDTSGDMLDTLNEYSVQFKKLGISGPTALGLIQQGLKGGARDSDVVGDSFKEFAIRISAGGEDVSEALGTIGMDATETQKAILAGGEGAATTTQTVIDKIQGIQNPITQAMVWSQLFGTQYEDMGTAVNGLDLGTAQQQLGTTAGAAEAAATSIENSFSRIDTAARNTKAGIGEAVEYVATSATQMGTSIATSTLQNESWGDRTTKMMDGWRLAIGGWMSGLGSAAASAAKTVGEKAGEIMADITGFLAGLVGLQDSSQIHADTSVLSGDQQTGLLQGGNLFDGGLLGGLFGSGNDSGGPSVSGGGGTFADGGEIRGQGGPREDNIPIWASNKEFVVNAADAQANLPLLHHINNGGSFADGGQVLANVLAGPTVALMGNWASTFKTQQQAAANARATSAAVGGPPGVAGGPFDPMVERWRPTVLQGLSLIGQPAGLADTVLNQIRTESSGDPNAINLTDSNAQAGHPSRGLVQTIPSTFSAYRLASLPDNIVDPLANIVSGMRYAIDRYGSIAQGMRGVAYDNGGPLAPGITMAVNKSGRTEEVLTAVERSAWVNQVRSGQGGGGGKTITIAAGAVQINGANASAQEIAAMVEQALTRIISEDDERALSG